MTSIVGKEQQYTDMMKPRPLCMNCRWKGVEVKNTFVMVCTAKKDTPTVTPDHTCEQWAKRIFYD